MQLIHVYYNVGKGVMQPVKVVAPIVYLKKAIDHRTLLTYSAALFMANYHFF